MRPMPTITGMMENTVEVAPLARPPRAWPLGGLLAVPVSVGIAFVVHVWASRDEITANPRRYSIFLGLVLGAALIAGLAQFFWPALRRWMQHMCPILAGAVMFLTVWETITSGLHWLPLPYFPSPAGVLGSLVEDRALLFDSTWHSLLLLFSGYALGAVVALITGVCIGWFARARYWGMPLLKDRKSVV